MVAVSARHLLGTDFADWLVAHAATLDAGASVSDEVVPRLGAAGLLRIGVPPAHGGGGGDVRDGVEAIAAVAEHSLTAAFMFWGQRAFVEYLLQSTNDVLRARWLPDLLGGRVAGATGLSNAMKFLAGIETLQLRAVPAGEGLRLEGRLPWVTNLRPSGFVVAAAVEPEGGVPFVAALPSDRAGLARTPDLDLIALRGSQTAALSVDALGVQPADLIAEDAREYLPRVRPAFLGLQCGLSIGLARAALREADALGSGARPVLAAPIAEAHAALQRAVAELHEGLADNRFVRRAAPLFRIRIRLAEVVQQAVQLELQATGGRAYLRGQTAFARRWAEAAFVPVVTPSLTQLEGALLKEAQAS